MGERAEIIFA